MIIGVPREGHRHEHRVGLTPFAVSRLVQQGHTVCVETRAGEEAHFHDRDYERSGAQIVYTAEEAYRRADLVCRVAMLSAEDLELLRPASIVCGFQHLAVAPREVITRLMHLDTTLISYELIRSAGDVRPVLVPFSEMGGRLAVQLAAHYLQIESGGRGVLLGNLPGIPPPTVLILGAGGVGRSAARLALAMGAHVIVLDEDLEKLATLNRCVGDQAVTVLAAAERLAQYTPIADVIIGAVLIPGERAPFLVTEEMVRSMKKGSVIVDVSIDQGGCIETSRPTTLDDPTFTVHGVVHYCVPNMTASIARTASRALAHAALPYLLELAGSGPDRALAHDAGLAAGTSLFRGKVVQRTLGQALGVEVTPLEVLLEGRRPR
ncbi:MAG: alanine dehydrogenase [Thermoanaerobaculia bacterium]|nr:MAG: alanine dehydrogenase [Thermoanaerobaculia bacterium]